MRMILHKLSITLLLGMMISGSGFAGGDYDTDVEAKSKCASNISEKVTNGETRYICAKLKTEIQPAQIAKIDTAKECGAASFYAKTDLQGQACEQALKVVNQSNRREESINKITETLVSGTAQIQTMKAKNSQDAFQANASMLKTAGTAMIAKGVAAIASAESMRQAGNAAEHASTKMQSEAQEVALSCGNGLKGIEKQNCIVAKSKIKAASLNLTPKDAATYAENLANAAKQTSTAAEKAKDGATSSLIQGAMQTITGFLAMKQAKMQQQAAQSLISPITGLPYTIRTPGLAPPPVVSGASKNNNGLDWSDSGSNGGTGLPDNAGGGGISGGIVDAKFGVPGPQYKGLASGGVTGGGAPGGGGGGGGGSGGGGSGKKDNKKSSSKSISGNGPQDRTGSGGVLSSGNRGGSDSGTNDLIKNLMGQLNGKNPAANTNAAGDENREPAAENSVSDTPMSTAQTVDLSIFEQVTAKIRNLHSNGII